MRAQEDVSAARTVFQIYVRAQVHLARDCLEDETLLTPRGQWELDLPVDTTWSDERRVKGLDLVGGHDDLDVPSGVETIELVEELQHSTLDFAFTTRC